MSSRYQAWVASHQPRGIPGPAGGGREGGMRVRGYIPPPIDLTHIQGPIFTQGAGDPPYPPYYNLQALGQVTPVKDQGEDPIFDQGGNDWMSTALLARGTGAVDEKTCPYQLGGYRPEPIPAGDLPNGREKVSVPLQEAMYLFNTDTPVSASDVKYALNHEVCIVGWNDTFEPCRFPADNRPAAPGAWIVRNSWSRYWGNGGYLYLSYDSKVFDGTVFLGGPRTTHRIHQYDPLGWVDSIGLGTPTAICANIFRADEPEQITAVSFYTGAAGSSYEIELRTGVTGDPGTGVSASAGLPPQQGSFNAPGYHIVPLDLPVTVAQGSDFAVLVKLTTPGYVYPIPVQDAEPGYSDQSFAEHGRSFMSADGTIWLDLSADCQGAAVCVKAFAEKVE